MTSIAPVDIAALRDEHWSAVQAIYAQGIATANATFETAPPSWERWDSRHLPDHRFVALAGNIVVGWAALSTVSDRCAYAGVTEDSVYVSERARGIGVGRRLLEAVIASADHDDIWTIQSGIFPENVASLELHRRCGFRVVGVRERLGVLQGRWRDVVLVERRKP